MAGSYKPAVVFPFHYAGAKTARIQIEPFACVYCYGLTIKVILEMTGGTENDKYVYERIALEDAITQENLKDGFMCEPFAEIMEGFYYNKTDINILIPVCAMIIKMYFPDILEMFDIDFSEYVVDVQFQKEEIGFKSNVSNYSSNKTSYKNETSSSACNEHNKKEIKAFSKQYSRFNNK